MDGLDIQFNADVSSPIPIPPTCPLQIPSLHYPTSPLNPPSPTLLSFTASLQYAWSFITIPRIHFISEFLAFSLIALMIFKTLFYVKRRRAGSIGPQSAIPLLKFWTCYAIFDSLAFMLSLYFSVFKLTWLISLLRALTMLVIISNRRLTAISSLYDNHLKPFYDTNSSEIDSYVDILRTKWRSIDQAFQELAKYLLKRMAVGGLSGVGTALGELFTEAIMQDAHNKDPSITIDSQKQSQHQTLSQQTNTTVDNNDLWGGTRNFFAGQPEEKAKAIAKQVTTTQHTRTNDLINLVKPPNLEMPRGAYEQVKEMRRQFRRKSSSKDKCAKG